MVSKTDSGESRIDHTKTEEERAPNTLFNALVGAAVSVVLGVLPFSPVLGGGIAGYLEGGTSRTGASVGAISGVFVAIPLILVVLLVSTVFLIVPEGGAVRLAVLLLAIVVGLIVYSVGFSIIGGILGVYIRNEV